MEGSFILLISFEITCLRLIDGLNEIDGRLNEIDGRLN